jgi:hypothetical protein
MTRFYRITWFRNINLFFYKADNIVFLNHTIIYGHVPSSKFSKNIVSVLCILSLFLVIKSAIEVATISVNTDPSNPNW